MAGEKGQDLDDQLLQVAGQSQANSKRKRNDIIPSDISEDDISDVIEEDWGCVHFFTTVLGMLALLRCVHHFCLCSGDESEPEDDERLAKMTELEREMELAERAERRQQKLQREQLLRAAEEGPRRSGREVREETKKKSAIKELKAARERKARGDTWGASLPSEDEEEEEQGAYVSEEDDYEDILDQHMDEDEGDEEEASYQEIKSIQIRRHKLEEWFSKPFFEETLSGCMVRLAAGNKKAPDGHTMYGPDGKPVVQYMAARVAGLVEKEPGYYKYLQDAAPPWKSPYPFAKEKTSLWLRVMRGNSERIWPLAQVSNSSITEQEFFRYHQLCEQSKTPQISRGQVEKAKARLVAAENYVYTAEDVAKILESKKTKKNLALEKARLERERDAAQQRGDVELVAQLEQEMTMLKESYMGAAKNKGKNLSDINKKNARLNFHATIKSSNKDGAVEDASGLDPFSRRVTRPIVYWKTGDAGGPNGLQDDGEDNEKDETDRSGQDEAPKDNVRSEEELKVFDLSKLDLSLLDHAKPVNVIVRRLCGERCMPENNIKTKMESQKFMSRELMKRNVFYSLEELLNSSSQRDGSRSYHHRSR